MRCEECFQRYAASQVALNDWTFFYTLQIPARIAFRAVELEGYSSSLDCGVKRNNGRSSQEALDLVKTPRLGRKRYLFLPDFLRSMASVDGIDRMSCIASTPDGVSAGTNILRSRHGLILEGGRERGGCAGDGWVIVMELRGVLEWWEN